MKRKIPKYMKETVKRIKAMKCREETIVCKSKQQACKLCSILNDLNSILYQRMHKKVSIQNQPYWHFYVRGKKFNIDIELPSEVMKE